MKFPVPKHSITIAGRRTAISLEDEFWDCLREIANRRGETLTHLITTIDKDRRRRGGDLSSAIRLFVLRDHQHRVGKRRAA
jgi:predicted DNA-binding ribbon-helix-helix protein